MSFLKPLSASILFFTILFSQCYSQAHPERSLASLVDARRMTSDVRLLVGFGNRLGGTPSGDRSSRFVMNRLQSLGLQTQLDIDAERLVFVHSSWNLRVEKPRRLATLIRNEWLSGFSPSAQRTRARLVYLGDDEPSRSRMDSCAVLTERPITPHLYHTLAQEGVRCVLTFAPGDSTQYSQWALISDLEASAGNPIPAYNLSYSNGNTLRTELSKGHEVVVQFGSSTTVRMGEPKSVIATLKGASDDYFLVCAHGDSDSGGPGADDNASGVAGVLELSRVLSTLVRTGQLPRPKKSIVFAVWGSEYYSTEHFVKRRSESLSKILGVMNYDEIGTGATRDCLYFESNDVEGNELLMRTFNAVAEDYAGKRGYWREATTNPSQGGTDSYVFLPDYLKKLELPDVNIPSITVYTAAWNSVKFLRQTPGWKSKAWKGPSDSVLVDYSPYYHSSLDIPATTTDKEPHNMSSAVKAVGIALLRLAW